MTHDQINDQAPAHGMTSAQIQATQETYGIGPFVTVDMIIITAKWTPGQDKPGVEPLMLGIRRKHVPYQGRYALPGGFVDLDEDLLPAARRELQEETHVTLAQGAIIEQLRTFGRPGRDPRARNISVAHLALVPLTSLPRPEAGDDAAEATWLMLRDGQALLDSENVTPVDLAFDHAQIVQVAWERLSHLGSYSSAPLVLLPTPFGPDHLAALYDALEISCERRPSLDSLLKLGWIQQTPPPAQPATYSVSVQQTRWR